jgi:5-methylcytosine-specific restriction endonuclease McrA
MAIDYSVLPLSKGTPRCVTKRREEKEAARDERACREIVRRRDKGRCRVPNCNERDVEMHHVIPRSRSRRLKWAASNNCLLCKDHHDLRHAGVIQITGDANDELIITGDIDRLRFRL